MRLFKSIHITTRSMKREWFASYCNTWILDGSQRDILFTFHSDPFVIFFKFSSSWRASWNSSWQSGSSGWAVLTWGNIKILKKRNNKNKIQFFENVKFDEVKMRTKRKCGIIQVGSQLLFVTPVFKTWIIKFHE